jgi:predicted Zn-dependent peptidase
MKKVQCTKTSRGLRVLTVPHLGNSLTVLVLVKTGSHYEPAHINGISHFLEHMCFKGTTTRKGKDIMRFLDGLGAETNAFTGEELTGYYVKSIPKHWKKTLKVVADIYQHSTFPEEELQKEKGVVIGEMAMYEDMPMRKVHYIFDELMYGDQPAGRTILGTPKTIKKLTREDLVTYHGQQYVAENTVLIVSGNVEHKEILAFAEKEFAQISTKKSYSKEKTLFIQKDFALKNFYKKTDQTHILFGYEGYDKYHPDVHIARFIGVLLGGGMSSRLFERLREDMGVGYYVRAYHAAESDTGVMQIACGVDNLRVSEVLTTLYSECKKLTDTLVSIEELAKTKEYIIGNTFMGLDASDELAEFYGERELFGLSLVDPKSLLKKVESITPLDIQRVAKDLFVSKKLRIAPVGPHNEKTIDAYISDLKKNFKKK